MIVGITAASPALGILRGFSIDLLTALRWHVIGHTHVPISSPAVIVALDEETYRTPPFNSTPLTAWTREISPILTEIIESGAKVIGFDVVFPISIEQSEMPIGDQTLGARLRGFDRDFLRVLALNARSGKLVLGEVQNQDGPILPSPGQRLAVEQQRNIRFLNVHSDSDNVVRRVPLTFVVDGKAVPAMAVELASRALGTTVKTETDGSLTLAGYRIPTAVPNTLTLNFEGGTNDIPTFSLADLRACIHQNNQDFFRKHFDGKIVLIGVILDIEDRKITSKRFATMPNGAAAERCVQHGLPIKTKFVSSSIPGVYIHATAVNNLIQRNGLIEFDQISRSAIAITLAAVAVGIALGFGPLAAASAYFGITMIFTAIATAAFIHALVFPLVEAVLAGAFALALTTSYRVVVTDAATRLLRKSFGLYLAPVLIDKLITSNRLPALGGETRCITFIFFDLADFSALSETMIASEVSHSVEFVSVGND